MASANPHPSDTASGIVHSSACILSIGDELIRGQNLDTNSMALSARLMDLGIETIEHATIGDSVSATRDTIHRFIRDLRAPLIIITGGLGPTQDDLTREALAEVLGESLIEDPDSLARLTARLSARNRPVTDAQRTQALRPPSAIPIPNDNGTAPGLFAAFRQSAPSQPLIRTDIVCLPGPPNEWKPMFEAHIVKRLSPPRNRTVRTRLLHMYGLPEADAGAMIPGLMARDRNPLVGITASGGVLTWRIRALDPHAPQTLADYSSASAHNAASRADSVEDPLESTIGLIKDQMGEFIFGEGTDTLASVIIRELTHRRATVATVESCTGGLLGARLTDVPGASAAYGGGWVTYANAMKERLVGVQPQTLAQHGAVSSETALEMALGGLHRAAADFAVAITGIAGPDGGTPEKPVGTVWIAVAHAAATGPIAFVRRFLIPGTRADIRDRAATAALSLLRSMILNPCPQGPAHRQFWEAP